MYYRVAQPPNYSTIEEADELPVNFVERPYGTGEKAASFVAPDKLKRYHGPRVLERTCMPGLHYYESEREVSGVTDYNESDVIIPQEVGMRPDAMVPNFGEKRGISMALRSNVQFDGSFASEPNDSAEFEDEGHNNNSVNNEAYFPNAPWEFDDGIRPYDPERQQEFLEAANWIADNVSRGPLPSEMVESEEVARNIAENSFNDSILSIHNSSRNDNKVFPSNLSFSNRGGSLGGCSSIGNASRRSSGNNRSMNSSTDSTRRTSWENKRPEITKRLMFGGDTEPTLPNRTFPVPSKNLKGLYTPMQKMDFSVTDKANINKPQTSEGRLSLGQQFGNISIIPPPYPYKNQTFDPRTSTPKKAGALRKVGPASFLTQKSYAHNNSTVDNSSYFGNLFDSVNSTQLNEAMIFNPMVKSQLNSSHLNESTMFGNMFDTTADIDDSFIPNASHVSMNGSQLEKTQQPQQQTFVSNASHVSMNGSQLEKTQQPPQQPTSNSSPGRPLHNSTPNQSIPEISVTQVPVPSNSAHSSPEATRRYELDSNELLTKLSQSLPVEKKNNSSSHSKLNKTSRATKSSNKSFLAPTPKRQSFKTHPSPTITVADSGYGVSVHTKRCNCSAAEKTRNNCVSLNGEGATLKIITKPNIVSPPCCKDAQGKLNHIAAINAQKVTSLTKVIKQKQQEFKIMLAENLKMAQHNFQLKEMLKHANVGFHRQQNATNELVTKYQALQTQFEIAQHKLEQLEQGGSTTESATEKIVNRLTAAYDKILEHSEKQQQEIDDLTNMLEQVDEENGELSEKLREAGIMVTSHMSERSQNDSVFASMAEENTILSEHCGGYQAHVTRLENSVRRLDSRVQNLSAMNEDMAQRNRSLSAEVSMTVGPAARSDLLNASVPASNTSTTSEQNQTLDGSLLKILNFYKDVSENLQTQVQQRDERISTLENTVVNEGSMSDDLFDTTNVEGDSFVSVSPHRTSLDNSQIETTQNNQALQELGKKIASARTEIKGMKQLFHQAKTIMKDLADNPAKSRDPRVMSAFDNIYKQFKKVDKNKSVSFENSSVGNGARLNRSF